MAIVVNATTACTKVNTMCTNTYYSGKRRMFAKTILTVIKSTHKSILPSRYEVKYWRAFHPRLIFIVRKSLVVFESLVGFHYNCCRLILRGVHTSCTT